MRHQAGLRDHLEVILRAARAPERGPMAGAVVVASAVVVVVVLVLWGQLLVFAAGAGLAVFLLPVVDRLEDRGWPRSIAAIVSVLVVLLAAVTAVAAVLAILLDPAVRFIEDLPRLLADVSHSSAVLALPDWLRATVDGVIASAQAGLAPIGEEAAAADVAGEFMSLFGSLFPWLLLPVFLVYLLIDQPRMAAGFYRRVPQPWRADVRHTVASAIDDVRRYVRSEMVVGSIMFVIVTVGMLALGTLFEAPMLVYFGVLLGAVALVLELIPQVGPILSCLPALMLAAPSGADAVIAVGVFYFVAFNVEGSVLVPTFQGRINHFSGTAVLVIIAVGFGLAGILGAVVALPLAAVGRDLVRLLGSPSIRQDAVMGEPRAAAPASGPEPREVAEPAPIHAPV
ncbi:MAG: AI-2E family transporter [Candidatus Limnocylindrales bacterium]|jgi:predicted PurR-regulated permease PerM